MSATVIGGETISVRNITATDVFIKNAIGKGIPIFVVNSIIDKLDCSRITSGPVLCVGNTTREAAGPCSNCQSQS